MKNIMRLAVAAGIMMLLILSNVDASGRELAIVTNKNYPLDSITANSAKEIYLGEKLTEGRVKIKPMENSDDELYNKFIENVMESTIGKYKAHWIKKVFQDGTIPPVKNNSSAEILKLIAKVSGGIGYVWADEVKGDDVKVILKVVVGN
ncbi:MAG: hypothetical protein A2Z20_11030 [Bdellovibrionales bacterium RBG_16_40_8]|nr:MAG: hypothetical protein A2Z20_11030 [Bdellovibrionales bacterium RBG_16_40_8]